MDYLHRLGFVLKRPKKRLMKAKDEERKAFIIHYSQIREEAERIGAKIFFVDEAHFRADADLRCSMGGKWVLKGEPALQIHLRQPPVFQDPPSRPHAPFFGNPEQIAEDIRRYHEAGVSEIVFDFHYTQDGSVHVDYESALKALERFHSEVRSGG